MPSVIDPIRAGRETGAVTYTLTLLKGDGSPGEVQSPPVFALEPSELGEVSSSNLALESSLSKWFTTAVSGRAS